MREGVAWLSEESEAEGQTSEQPVEQPKAAPSELEQLMAQERLTPEQIAQARNLIETTLPAEERAAWYERLQEKVTYSNQRNNESPSEGPGGGTCNLTTLAMTLQYLGVPNPDPTRQYEDALDDIRIANSYGSITSGATWQKVAQHLGHNIEFHEGGKFDQAWFESTVRSWLQGGGVLVSINGHVARIQGMDADGLVVDDPYGASVLKPRPNGKPYSWGEAGRNEELSDGTSEGNVGEDLIWPWADVVEYNFKMFGVVR